MSKLKITVESEHGQPVTFESDFAILITMDEKPPSEGEQGRLSCGLAMSHPHKESLLVHAAVMIGRELAKSENQFLNLTGTMVMKTIEKAMSAAPVAEGEGGVSH